MTEKPQVFYWRTVSGQEVDIVLGNSAGHLVGVEVKASATLNSGDVRGLQTLGQCGRQALDSRRGALHRHRCCPICWQSARRSCVPPLGKAHILRFLFDSLTTLCHL